MLQELLRGLSFVSSFFLHMCKDLIWESLLSFVLVVKGHWSHGKLTLSTLVLHTAICELVEFTRIGAQQKLQGIFWWVLMWLYIFFFPSISLSQCLHLTLDSSWLTWKYKIQKHNSYTLPGHGSLVVAESRNLLHRFGRGPWRPICLNAEVLLIYCVKWQAFYPPRWTTMTSESHKTVQPNFRQWKYLCLTVL